MKEAHTYSTVAEILLSIQNAISGGITGDFPLIFRYIYIVLGFPDSSVGKESACNAGDPGSIPGWGKSAGEGIGYSLQYSWASLVAQLVKNLPVMWKTWVRSLGWEDPLEESMATHTTILAWRIPMDKRSLAGYSPWG